MSIQNHFSRIGRLLQQQSPGSAMQNAGPTISPLQALVIQAQQAQQATQGNQNTAAFAPLTPNPFVADQRVTTQVQPIANLPVAPVPAVALGFSGGTRLAEVATGEASLEPGDRGSAVQALQRFLGQQGHEVMPSGYFDTTTQAAVVAFQEEQGIVTDGVVGPQTLGFMVEPVLDSGEKDYKGRPVRGTAATLEGFKKIQDIAESKGFKVQVNSSYRTYNEQQTLWTQALRRYGSESAARKWVAPPGKSRHNAGNAIDINILKPNGQKISDREFARIIEQAGMHRPMAWEPWHVEPRTTGGSRELALNSLTDVDDTQMWA